MSSGSNALEDLFADMATGRARRHRRRRITKKWNHAPPARRVDRAHALRLLQEIRALGGTFDWHRGCAPAQVEGRLGTGEDFYFRVHGSGWSFTVSTDAGPSWRRTGVGAVRSQADVLLRVRGGLQGYAAWQRRGSRASDNGLADVAARGHHFRDAVRSLRAAV